MESITHTSYFISSISFLLLAVFYNQRLQGGTAVRAFILALLGSAVWSSIQLTPLTQKVLYGQMIPEILRSALWYHFLIETLGQTKSRGSYRRLHLFWLATLAALLLSASTPLPSAYAHLVLILTPVIGLFLVEQLYRNTSNEGLKHKRYIYFAIAGMFAFDLYIHIWSYMFQDTNIQLHAAKSLISCLTALFIFFGIKNSKDNYNFTISREVAFYSTSLIITGVFLTLIALGGYYIKIVGGQLSTFIQSTYFFSFLLVSAILLTSPRLRANLKVTINKHLFRHKHDYRLEWQRLIKSLTKHNSEEDIYTLAVIALGQIYHEPPGALWLLEDDELQLKACTKDIDINSLEQNTHLVEHLNNNNKILVCEEVKLYPEKFKGLSLPAFIYDNHFWFLSPLINQGELLGLIGLCKPTTQEQLVWEDFDLIHAASLQIASFIANENKTQDLMQAKQFDAYSKLTAFIMHDLKNLIAQQSLVVQNAAKHKDNPEFIEDAINTIDNSVKRMSSLLDQLKQDHEVEQASNISLNDILVNTVRKCHNREPRPALRLPHEDLTICSSAEQLSMIFGHIIRNAQEATDHTGFIDISVESNKQFATICIEDNGTGMSQEFIKSRLFKPFDTTKAAKGMGIGAYQTREFIRQAGGSVDIQSEEGQGTRFTINLPLVKKTLAD